MIHYFGHHPTAANLLMILIVVAGLATLPGLRRETLPDFSPEEVEVQVVYPGASAEDVEEVVCRRIEDAVDGLSGVGEVRCEAREGMGSTVVKMLPGTDFARFLDDVKIEVDAIDTFPEAAEEPVIAPLGRTDQVISLAVTGPMSTPDLKAYAEELKDRMQRLESLSQITIQGFSDHQLRVHVPALALNQYGLSMSDIANAIARQSVNLPAGSITTREREILLRFDDERDSVRELAELIVVGSESGAEIRLGDIAELSDRFELEEDKIEFNGARAAVLQVTKTKEQDTLTVVRAVEAFVAAERARAPPGVRFNLTQDVASIVADRLELLVKNGLQGLVLVVLTMWLFFTFRFAFWVAVGLPVSFLGGLFFMSLLGYSINMISMVALLIALGLLMDDAIVIAENVATHLARGKTPYAAAVAGTREVAPGVTASFLTTVAVFGPLAFLEGDIGKVLAVLPVALIGVLAVSLVEAFLILPHHLAHSLQHAAGRPPGRLRVAVEGRVEWLREAVLGRAVDWAVHWRYLFIGLVVAAFLGSVGFVAGGHVKFLAFPEIDGDVVEARILLPQGTPLWRTEAVVERVVGALGRVDAEFAPRQPGGQALVRNVNVRFRVNADAHEVGPHVATVSVDLLGAEIRDARVDAVLDAWRREVGDLPDILAINFKEPQIGPAGLAIDVRLGGPDLDELKAASLELQAWLRRYPGVLDLSDDLRPGKPEVRLRLRPGAYSLGLDAANIAGQLRAAFFGTTASEIQVGSEAYEVDVRLSDSDRDSLADLERYRLTAPDGSLVPLRAVATLERGRGFARIHRIDGQRTVTVQGDVDPHAANALEIIDDTRARLLPDLLARYPGIEIRFEGQAAEAGATGGSIRRGFLLGLIGIFILLSFQFRSYIQPLAVMVAIPLALIGVVWGHVLMGLDLSMPSIMGFVSLAGIVVNDSILLVTFLKLGVRDGLGVTEAAKRASRERFRAVLLTSLTTIAGLLPLLSEKSLQAQVLIPLITSIVFGLLVTTLLVLLVVPALFTILDDLGFVFVAVDEEIDEALAPAEEIRS